MRKATNEGRTKVGAVVTRSAVTDELLGSFLIVINVSDLYEHHKLILISIPKSLKIDATGKRGQSEICRAHAIIAGSRKRSENCQKGL